MKWWKIVALALSVLLVGCVETADEKDQKTVNKQQGIYLAVQPVHIYDYSIPRDIYQQIYDITVTQVVATYSIIESVTGVTRYECPSMGYALPADVQLTNPVQVADVAHGAVIEQAEPNGLYSSKNTDGTWVMCVMLQTGEVYPVYTEHKVTTFPFIMKKDERGQWVRADDKPIAFKITIKKGDGGKQSPPVAK